MKKHNSVLVPVEFLTLTYLLIEELEELEDFYDLGSFTHERCERLRYLIDEKFAAMNKRKTFTEYKIAPPGSTEREALRRAYLDLSFTPNDWRSSYETLRPSFDDDDIPF
jgi:hypothetical protein